MEALHEAARAQQAIQSCAQSTSRDGLMSCVGLERADSFESFQVRYIKIVSTYCKPCLAETSS